MKKTYLIGNAHLDPVWQWPWQEGYSEALATFRSALDRMKDFPDFKFTSACAVYYMWVEEQDPEMFKEIQQRVREGRWNIVGGWYLQPDCNLPAGESFARHALISQRYFKEKFGVTVKTGYNVDSFGHNWNLPKILRASGMENYVFMRPNPEEKPEVTKSLFSWEADDGSRVTAYRIPQPYNIRLEKRFQRLEEIIAQAQEEGTDLMAFYGVGNHGGGPTIRLIRALKDANYENTLFSTPDEYFAEVAQAGIPVVRDELQHHARGCYSAESSIKMGIRRAEQKLLAAERLAVLGKELLGVPYPAEELKKAWKNVLFNQFHDIAGGCSLRKAYTDAAVQLGESVAIADRVINKATQAIAWNIDTLQGETLPGDMRTTNKTWEHEILGTPIVVFNPHAFPVRAVVSLLEDAATKVADAAGNEIPMQRIRCESNIRPGGNYHPAFLAEIPALGYAVYRMFMQQPSRLTPGFCLKIDRKTMENDVISVEFDAYTGDICKIFDKKANKTIMDRPCRAILLDESTCDTWAHDRVYLGPEVAWFKNADLAVADKGDVQVTLCTTAYCGENVLKREYTLIPGSKEIRVKAKVEMREPLRTFKLAFPIEGDEVTAQIPYGSIKRKGETGEEPCGSWIAGGGVGVANNGQYGYDYRDGEMRLTVLRTAAYLDHSTVRDAYSVYMDMGTTEFEYTVFPFEGAGKAEETAARLNCPPVIIKGSFHNGRLPEVYGGIKGEGAAISAIKEGEDGGTVIRVFEPDGEEREVSVELFGKELKTKLRPHQLKTLHESGEELNLIEWALR
ncbi:MAG: alpha-mannosidase [Clostridia bacterium]|nr:alpha-mannosidase [Clostridia bacterium]